MYMHVTYILSKITFNILMWSICFHIHHIRYLWETFCSNCLSYIKLRSNKVKIYEYIYILAVSPRHACGKKRTHTYYYRNPVVSRRIRKISKMFFFVRAIPLKMWIFGNCFLFTHFWSKNIHFVKIS